MCRNAYYELLAMNMNITCKFSFEFFYEFQFDLHERRREDGKRIKKILKVDGFVDGDGCLELGQSSTTGQINVLQLRQLPGRLQTNRTVKVNVKFNLLMIFV